MSMHKFRTHQKALDNWFKQPENFDPATGTLHKKVVSLNVTPGGGKSMLPSIMATHLIPSGAIDLICWVTPRQNLSKQAADGFEVDRGEYYNFHCPYKGKFRQNRAPILGPEEIFEEQIRCYTTTYNAILSAKNKTGFHTWMFNRYKVALVLDECHHLADIEEGQAFCEAVRPLQEMAAFTMVMTGTPDRNDGKQIPFIEYPFKDPSKDRFMPSFDVIYDREKAISEGAKLPINFQVLDGTFTFEEEDSEPVDIDSDGILLSTADDLQRRQVFNKGMGTNSDYVRQAIDRTCRDFLDNRSAINYPHAQVIFVVTLQDHADHWQRYIEREHGLKCALAVSNNSESCAQIMRFRDGAYDALITVGMAYEGLDAPATTHMCVLRNIRSEPFLEQCFDRATRIDYRSTSAPQSQCAHIYVPSDGKMGTIIENLYEKQGKGIEMLRKRVAEEDIKDLNGELPEGVERPAMFDQVVLDAIEGNGEVTSALLDRAKAQITLNSPIEQHIKVNELEKRFLAEQLRRRRIDELTEGEEEGWPPEDSPMIRVTSSVTGQSLITMKHPVMSEKQIHILTTAVQEFPELKWASADRVLKAVEDGQLCLNLEVSK